MSSRENRQRLIRVALAGLLCAVGLGSGCTVRPLYSSAPLTSGLAPGAGEGLRSIAIKPVDTRPAQQVRNDLVFLFNGGAAEPASPSYSLDLKVTTLAQDVAIVKVVNEDRATAGTLKMTGAYVLTDVATGKPAFFGKRQIVSSYDLPTQEFAAYRSRRDAEDRAARELAELLSLDISQRLAKR